MSDFVASSINGGSTTTSGTDDLIRNAVDFSGGTWVNTPGPNLGPLASNGGPTQTMALLAGSPAIDNGNNTAAAAASLKYDQRGSGYARIVNGSVDLGAFEFQTLTTTAVTSSASPSTCGESVTFTATVTALSTPTGSVRFVIDSPGQRPGNCRFQ